MNAKLIIGGLALVASTVLFAQTPATPGQSGADREPGLRRPCAQESDPAKCEAQRKEMREKRRETFKSARESCKGKDGPDHEKCIAQQMCANNPDPAKCIAHARERRDQRRQIRDKAVPKT